MKKSLLAAVGIVLITAGTANAGPLYDGARLAGKAAVKVAHAGKVAARAVGHYVAGVARAL